MHKTFFRLLLSIVGITLCVLLLQIAMIVLLNFALSRSWSKNVFNEFAAVFEEEIEKVGESAKPDGVINLSLSQASERISGIIFRNTANEVVLSLGKNRSGIPLPSYQTVLSEPRFNSVVDVQQIRVLAATGEGGELVERRIDKPKYEIKINADLNQAGAVERITSLEFEKLKNKGKTTVLYPEGVKSNDVAGSFVISVNGVPSVYIDVIVFGLRNYKPTEYIINQIIKCFLLTLPIAILLSFVGAYHISKRNAAIVRSYQDAMNKLASGDFNITVPETGLEELDGVSKSLKKLARDLEAHSNSRKEWIRSISHDLNTPLSSMNILLSGAHDGLFPINEDLIKSLKTENDILISRIASVTYYSYLLSPECRVKNQNTSLFEAVDTVVGRMKIDVKASLNPDTFVVADPAFLSRVIEEVLNNAERYKSGDDVLIKEKVKDGIVILQIINKGQLPYPRPNFYEPWARGDESRSSGGSGMGLSIAYQIMALFGGSIEIRENDCFVEVSLSFRSSHAE